MRMVYKPKLSDGRLVYNMPKETTRHVGKLLSTIQQKRGLTQEQVAAQIGVSKETIRSIFSKTEMSNKTLELIKIWARRVA